MENMITLKQGNIRIVIRKYEEGYLATVDSLDEDGDVEFGCSGNFSNDIQKAVWNAIDYFYYSFEETVDCALIPMIK